MNLEELVRAALAEEAKAEPGEAGAYERFLRRRRRGALAVAASTGLAVALVLAVAIGGGLVVRGGRGVGGAAGPVAPATTAAGDADHRAGTGAGRDHPAGPAAGARLRRRGGPPGAPGVRADPAQGLEGGPVDDRGATHQFGQPWLVISPGGRQVSATEDRRITIFTAVAPPNEYPGKPVKDAGAMGGQSFSSLSGARSSGRRPDGRAFAVGDQGAMFSYHIAWPYRCEPADLCPEAGPWRVLQLDVEGTGRQEGLKVRRVARQLVETIRPITNALAAGRGDGGRGAGPVRGRGRGGRPRRPGRLRLGGPGAQGLRPGLLDRDAPPERRPVHGRVVQPPAPRRPVAYIHCTPSRERATATLLMGVATEAVTRVVVELEGQPPVETQTFRKKGFPFAFWVVAPLPPEARPRSFTIFDAAGQQVAKGTDFAGYADGCR